MSDFFNSISKDLIKDQTEINPIILNNDNYDFVMVTDYYITEIEIMVLTELLYKKIGHKVNLKIIYPFKFIPSEKDLKKNIANFYYDNSIDLKKYIKPNSKIVTLGRAINAITYNTDFGVEAFYDINFNKQYFYSSHLDSYVFPVDTFDKFWGKDNWYNYFAILQFKNAYNIQFKQSRKVITNCVIVEDIDKFLNENMDPKEVAWDIETSGFNFMSDKIGCITISFDGITGYFLDWKNVNKELLNKFFENKYQILANGKFDCKFLRYNGISNARVDFDTYGAGHCLNEMRSNSLKTHSWLYTNLGGYEQELDNYIRKYKCRNFLTIPTSILSKYATMDAIVTFQVYKEMKNQLLEIDKKAFKENKKWCLSKYYYDIMIPSTNMFIELEMKGAYINWDKVKEAEYKMKDEIIDIKKQLSDSFNIPVNDFNWTSNVKLGKLLEKNGWSNHGCSIKGNYLVNEDTLQAWVKEGHKEATLILKLHELNTLMGTFVGEESTEVEILEDFFSNDISYKTVSEDTGFYQYKYLDNKIHSTYGVMTTDSGRNSSGNPNLQNQPKHGDNAKMVRSYFTTPDKNYDIVEFDAAGFQLRIGALLSNDIFMRKAFDELGGDLHSMTAAEIMMNGTISVEDFIKRKKEKEFSEIRFKSKSTNFGFLFGATGLTFSEQIKKEWTLKDVENYLIENNLSRRPVELLKNETAITRRLNLEDCKYWAVGNDIRKKYFTKYAQLEQWHKDTIDFAEENGYVKSVYGCIRRLPQLLYKGERSFETKNLQNISLNSPVQNFEIAKITLTMLEMFNWLKEQNMKSSLVMTVHDSIVMYVYKPELKKVILKMKEIFEKDCIENNNIPMVIEWDVADYFKGEVWGFGRELKLNEI